MKSGAAVDLRPWPRASFGPGICCDSARGTKEMAARTHKIVIGVMGPAACDPDTAALARGVGRAIAERGGGGGVRGAPAEGAKSAGGLTLGVLPGTSQRESPPNPYIDIAVFTGLGE